MVLNNVAADYKAVMRQVHSTQFRIAVAATSLFFALAGWVVLRRISIIELKFALAIEDKALAEQAGRRLAETRGGVDFALSDFDGYGGETKGWSSWILKSSNQPDYVLASLLRIARAPQENPSRRMEAYDLLLDLSNGRREYLTEFEALVQNSPGAAHERGLLFLRTHVPPSASTLP